MTQTSAPTQRYANLGNLLRDAARAYPDRIAVVCDDVKVSYEQLNRRVNSVAAAMIDLGLARGDRVVLWMRNCPELIEILFACWKIGLVAVPVNSRLTPGEIDFHIEDCGAAALVYGQEHSESAGQVHGRRKISIDGDGDTRYADLTARAVVSEMSVDLPEDAPAWLFYTSGTTGRPKAANLTHRNLLFTTVSWCADLYCVRPEDVVLHCAPLSHGAGFYALVGIARGATNVVHRIFRPDAVLADIARHAITATWLVPTQIRLLLDSPDIRTADLASLKSIIYGGAPMYRRDLDEALERFGPILCQLYGQGESPMTISYLRPEAHRDLAGTTAGPPAGIARTGMEVQIRTREGMIAPFGITGEIVVRGPAVMSGYWNRAEESATALADGWLHTGDLGRIDERGSLTVLDRIKDFIISGGSNVYAREVEDVLVAHPDVLEAAVFGIRDPLWGEAVTAAVTGNNDLDLDGLAAHCRMYLADYKCPKQVYLRSELPKNAYGKVLKRELRQFYAPRTPI